VGSVHILQCTAFLLATMHSDGVKSPLPQEASESVLSFELASLHM